MSALKMNGYKVAEMKFVNKAENGTKLSLQTTYSFNVRYTPDSKNCIARLDIKVGDKDKADVFAIEMSILGNFSVTDTDVAKEKLHVEAYRSLFPFARSIVSSISVNAGIPPIIIAQMDIEKQSIYRIDTNPPKDFS